MTWTAIALLAVACAYRLVLVRRQPNWVNISHAIAVIAAAVGFAAVTAAPLIDAALGANATDLVGHMFVVIGAVSAQMLVLGIRVSRPPVRAAAAGVVIACVVLAVMAITFAAAPIHQRAVLDLVVDPNYVQLTSVAIYRAVFEAYLAYVLVDIVRLCRRYAGIPGDLGRRASLALLGWGCVISVGYAVFNIAYIVIQQTAHRTVPVLHDLGSLAARIGLGMLAIGLLVPQLLPATRRWLTTLAGIRRLGPLWRAVTAHAPAATLPTPLPITPRRAELRHDRRIIEVAEGLAMIEAASNHDGSEQEATTRLRHLAADPTLAQPRDAAAERARILQLATAYRSRIPAPIDARARSPR
ncbi:MAB_1171c family putative transporter [Nakamurella endophytica]|uniref:DUF6545 domain-containing protein n=1 Tax=Nakamurella endophytica TaxID=1748367 RepID=A0A917TAF1_9ACTN|nr:MAB_1171c family putative transporter [Nakamurella endophytica]GGM16023.1 hypothetical protein GCM10011594_40030 [Nakamurella endophytica]